MGQIVRDKAVAAGGSGSKGGGLHRYRDCTCIRLGRGASAAAPVSSTRSDGVTVPPPSVVSVAPGELSPAISSSWNVQPAARSSRTRVTVRERRFTIDTLQFIVRPWSGRRCSTLCPGQIDAFDECLLRKKEENNDRNRRNRADRHQVRHTSLANNVRTRIQRQSRYPISLTLYRFVAINCESRVYPIQSAISNHENGPGPASGPGRQVRHFILTKGERWPLALPKTGNC